MISEFAPRQNNAPNRAPSAGSCRAQRRARAAVRDGLAALAPRHGLLGAALALAAALPIVWGQDDPFGGAAPPPRAPAGETSPAPPVGAEPKLPAHEADPVVLSIRERKVATPSDRVEAASQLIDYGRKDVARVYLHQLLSAKLDTPALLALHNEFGALLFRSMTRDPALQPEGLAFGEAVLAAASEGAKTTPVDDTVRQLSSPMFEQRQQGVQTLQLLGARGVVGLLRALGDRARESERAQIVGSLTRLGAEAEEPLLGLLESPDAYVREQALFALCHHGSRRVAVYAWAAAFDAKTPPRLRRHLAAVVRANFSPPYDAAAAQHALTEQYKIHLGGFPPRKPNTDDLVEMWRWNDAERSATPKLYSIAEAALVEARRLSGAILTLPLDLSEPSSASKGDSAAKAATSKLKPELTPARRAELLEQRRRHWLVSLASEQLDAGLDQPLPRGAGGVFERLSKEDLAEAEWLLAEALRIDLPPAALGAIDVLAARNDARMVLSASGAPRALAAALRGPDRRVRSRAAAAVVALRPAEPFPGCSFLPEALGFLATAGGRRKALVAHPNLAVAQHLGGLLREIGYDPELAHTEAQAFAVATRDADFEFGLVDLPRDLELVQALRRDPRSARLPVALLHERRQNLTDLDRHTVAFRHPYSTELLGYFVEHMLARVESRPVLREERLAQADAALDGLMAIAAAPDVYAYHDLYRQQPQLLTALRRPENAVKAAEVLGRVGSMQAQCGLIELANQTAAPLAARQAAAKALADAITRRGVLVSRAEVDRQYVAYERFDESTEEGRRVLEQVLDALEAPQRDERAAVARLYPRLLSREFTGRTLGDAARFLSDLTGVDIRLGPSAEPKRDLPVEFKFRGLRVKDILSRLGEELGLTWRVEGHAVVIDSI